MISSLGYLRISSANPAAWREFGVKVLGLTEGRGPEEGAVYLRMDDYPARLAIIPGSSEQLLASGWEVADAHALAAVGRALADAGVPYKAATDGRLVDDATWISRETTAVSLWGHSFAGPATP